MHSFLCGAIPIYIEMSVDPKIGIALGLENDRVAQAIKEHPDAKAILINNPTYYGICSDLKGLTEMAHAAGMKVLVDEAHGAHLHFTDKTSSIRYGCRSRYVSCIYA